MRTWNELRPSIEPLILALTIPILALGCSGGQEPRRATCKVQGKVLYQGKPVPQGTVQFIPQDPTLPSAHGSIQPDGSFVLETYQRGDGVVPGEHKVVIQAFEAVAPSTIEVNGQSIPNDNPGQKAPKALVPQRYSQLETTPLTETVADSKEGQVIELELKDK